MQVESFTDGSSSSPARLRSTGGEQHGGAAARGRAAEVNLPSASTAADGTWPAPRAPSPLLCALAVVSVVVTIVLLSFVLETAHVPLGARLPRAGTLVCGKLSLMHIYAVCETCDCMRGCASTLAALS